MGGRVEPVLPLTAYPRATRRTKWPSTSQQATRRVGALSVSEAKLKNKLADSWTKRSKKSGKFMDVKKSAKKFKVFDGRRRPEPLLRSQARHQRWQGPGASRTSSTCVRS
jgi:hypothetical protein